MTTRHSHGKARTELPRSSELPATVPQLERTQGRTAKGTFAAGHGLSYVKSWHLRMAEQLGTELEGEAGQLAREAYRMYRAFLRELPCTSASINALVAQRARAGVLAAFLARSATEAGLGTPDGERRLAQAATWDARAERLAVTSLDLSTRAAMLAAKRKPNDAHARVLDAFGRKGEP
jgi:hypothetical protein